MGIFLNSMQSISSIVILVAVGYVLTAQKWFDDSTAKLFALLVNCVALPTYMIWNLLGSFDQTKIFALMGGLAVPYLSIGLCYLVSYAVSLALGIGPERRGTFRFMFALSNTLFMGLPVNLALFGEKSVPYVLLFYLASTSLLWTVGKYGLSTDGSAADTKFFSRETLSHIASPPLIGFAIGIALIFTGLTLPRPILDVCKYLGSITTPLCMLFIGIALFDVKFREIRMDKDTLAVLLGRFVISPLLVLAVASFIPIPLLMKKVFVVQAAMPVPGNSSILAQYYKADYRYAAVLTALTTILMVVVIPLYMALL